MRTALGLLIIAILAGCDGTSPTATKAAPPAATTTLAPSPPAVERPGLSPAVVAALSPKAEPPDATWRPSAPAGKQLPDSAHYTAKGAYAPYNDVADWREEIASSDALSQCCPGLFRSGYYLTLACELQKLSFSERNKKLKEMAQDHRTEGCVIVLCRMLFEAPPGEEFRGPRIGEPAFIDGAKGVWSDPITLYKGVPILVVHGYALVGLPEPAGSYLEYCVSSCQERKVRFKPMTTEEIGKVIEEFSLSHPKFKPGEVLAWQARPW